MFYLKNNLKLGLALSLSGSLCILALSPLNAQARDFKSKRTLAASTGSKTATKDEESKPTEQPEAATTERKVVFPSLPKWVLLTTTGSTGWHRQPVLDFQKMPFLMNFGLGIDLGFRFSPKWAVGLSNSVDFINQYSEVTVGTGNRRGMILNWLSPNVYFSPNDKIDFSAGFKWYGRYSLWTKSAIGTSYIYNGLMAGTLKCDYAIWSWVSLGLGFDYGRYANMNVSSVGDRALSDALDYFNTTLYLKVSLH